MKVLLIGSGGREAAIAEKLRASRHVTELYCIPGNAGIAKTAVCVPHLKATDVAGVTAWAVEHGMDAVMVAPDDPQAAGMVDAVEAAGVPAFGATAAAARIESSKSFAKKLMDEAGVPTARWAEFVDPGAAEAYIDAQGAPIVVKADGLALGKGVTVAATADEAKAAVRRLMVDKAFAQSGTRVVIEECMIGPEVTLLCFADGRTAIPMIASQDHKRVGTGDVGPNTGGMGAFAPTPRFTRGHLAYTMERIVVPVLRRMEAMGAPFRGILYAGLMLTSEGPKVVEFNARFGDPEAQAVLPLLKTDLMDILMACREGRLDGMTVEWSDEATCCLVLASRGYPGDYEIGKPITGIGDAEAQGAAVYHAGTAMKDGTLVTAGGRVLGVVGRGATVPEASRRAYAAAARIGFEGKYFRTDIGAI